MTGRDDLLALCRGSYQRNLILGHESWSGSTLAGQARVWGARYAESRRNLLDRILAAGFDAGLDLVLMGAPRRWRRVLVVDGQVIA